MNGSFKSLTAAADFLGNGAIEVPMYEKEVTDIVRRTSVALARFKAPPANGAFHRYFEQTGIATGSFSDPRNLAPVPSGPTRVERPAAIKAVVAQTNMTLFDTAVTRQQGQFASTEAKDVEDVANGVAVAEASAIWTGNDTSLAVPTTVQYMGLLSQITQVGAVALGASIIDGLKAEVAQMVGNAQFGVKPSAIYIPPVLGDYIDREAKAQALTLDKVEVTAGVWVKAIMTQAGPLPLIPDPYLAPQTAAFGSVAAPSAGNKAYPAVIVSEDMIEMPYIGVSDNSSSKPMLFQLGLQSSLAKQWVAVHFNTIIAKGPSYAHAIVTVIRP